MEVWHIWVIVTLLFFILEIFTAGFAVACFSIGAAGAAIVAGCGGSFLWQLIVFAVLSLVALVVVRPIVMKTFYKKDTTATNADALIGREGRVSEAIDPETGKGRVAIDGDDWKAVSEDGTPIEKGIKVAVISRDGVIVTVKKS